MSTISTYTAEYITVLPHTSNYHKLNLNYVLNSGVTNQDDGQAETGKTRQNSGTSRGAAWL